MEEEWWAVKEEWEVRWRTVAAVRMSGTSGVVDDVRPVLGVEISFAVLAGDVVRR